MHVTHPFFVESIKDRAAYEIDGGAPVSWKALVSFLMLLPCMFVASSMCLRWFRGSIVTAWVVVGVCVAWAGRVDGGVVSFVNARVNDYWTTMLVA